MAAKEIPLPAIKPKIKPVSIDAPDNISESAYMYLRRKAISVRNKIGVFINVIGLEHKDFSVISNDCWGQALYEDFGLPCRTPLAGSGMHAECFLRFLGDLEGYINSPLQFISKSRHPSINRLRLKRDVWPMALIGGDVEVHFLHFSNEEDSRLAWETGCKLINLDRIAVKFSVDKDGALPEHILQFNALNFERKLLISEREHPEIPCAIRVPNYIINGAMMFRRSLRFFDCAHWLNTGEVRKITFRVLLNKILYLRGA